MTHKSEAFSIVIDSFGGTPAEKAWEKIISICIKRGLWRAKIVYNSTQQLHLKFKNVIEQGETAGKKYLETEIDKKEVANITLIMKQNPQLNGFLLYDRITPTYGFFTKECLGIANITKQEQCSLKNAIKKIEPLALEQEIVERILNYEAAGKNDKELIKIGEFVEMHTLKMWCSKDNRK
jgi:hypothetical protein